MTKKTRQAIQQGLQRALLEPSLGRRLQAVRKALGMTGADVVEQIPGLNRSTLSEIENDVSRRTSYLTRLSEVYGVSEETLLRPDLGSLIREDSLGDRIRRRRDDLNYSRKELAAAIPGLTYHTLFMIETKDRQSEYTPAVVAFLGLNNREEEHNASALLRTMRTDMFLESAMLCEIAGCEPETLRQAEDGDTAAAVRVIMDLSQGLLQDYLKQRGIAPVVADGESVGTDYRVPEEPMAAAVYDVDDSGRLTLPRGTDIPEAIAMPDGQRLYTVPGTPEPGEYAMAIVPHRAGRSGLVGTYQAREHGASLVDPSNIMHTISDQTVLHRLLPFEEYLTA